MKTLQLILIFSLVAFAFQAVGQSDEERIFEPIVAYQKGKDGLIVLSPDSSIALQYGWQGYTLYLPSKHPPKGMMVLFTGKPPEVAIPEDGLVQPLLSRQLALMFVDTGNRVDFYFEDETLKLVDSLIGQVLVKYNIPSDALLFAGLSLAGTRAMKYAIYCMQGKSKFAIQPAAIALCDAPLDFERFWWAMQRALTNNFHPNASGEAKWVSYYMSQQLGGTFEEQPQAYRDYSPFCYSQPNSGNAIWFKNIPIRAYHEPDINWWIDNRRKDYYSINSIDQAALINKLKLMGNEQAELVSTHRQRAGLVDGASPHSWSIIDNEELVEWFVGILKSRK